MAGETVHEWQIQAEPGSETWNRLPYYLWLAVDRLRNAYLHESAQLDAAAPEDLESPAATAAFNEKRLKLTERIEKIGFRRGTGVEMSAASIAKLNASKLAVEATSEIAQMFGWRGIDGDHSIQKRFRDARQTTIFEGTSELQKLNLFRSLLRSWHAEGEF